MKVFQMSGAVSYVFVGIFTLCSRKTQVLGGVIPEPEEENIFHNLEDTYGGDMLLTQEQIQALESGYEETHTQTPNTKHSKRKFVTDIRESWPKGIVPYKFSMGSTKLRHPKARAYITAAIEHWEKFTCLQFRDITRNPHLQMELLTQLGHGGYIIFATGSGCGSMVGLYGRPQPVMLLEPYCLQPGTVIHEIGHAIGFFHEQERQDRDKYVEIRSKHIKPGREVNFRLSYTSTLDIPYDLGSTMHYGPYFFSKDGKPTMVPRDKNLEFLMGRREGLSFYDIMAANKAYKCSASCPSNVQCENGGFVTKDCTCACPNGLGGGRCETVDTQNCGGIKLLSKGETLTITSPEYPKLYKNQLCSWLVKAPLGEKIRTSILMDYLPKDTFDGEDFCYHWIEVRYNLVGQEGPRYCGTKKTFTLPLSTNNTVTLLFDSTDEDYSGTGFRADLRIEDDSVSNHVIFDCTFQVDTCGFRSPVSSGHAWRDFLWKMFGPSYDHTNNSKQSFLAEDTFIKEWWKFSTSVTEGPLIIPIKFGKHCLEFWYFADGEKMGHLKLFLVTENTISRELIWEVNEEKYIGKWNFINVQIDVQQSFRILFELTTKKIYDNFAVDDIKITEGNCFEISAATLL